jgi:hypothetical protein
MASVPALAKEIDELSESIPDAQSFHDLAALELLYLIRVLEFCDRHAGSRAYDSLLDGFTVAQIRFDNGIGAVHNELLARPGEDTSKFTRRFGLLPSKFTRQLPQDLRKALSVVSSRRVMSSLGIATSTFAVVAANIAILRSFPLSLDARWQYLCNIIETMIVNAPGAIRSLPSDVISWLKEEPPAYWPCCQVRPLVKEFVTDNTQFLNFVTPMANSSNRRVHAIGKAVATNDVRFIDDAISEIRRIRWYITSTDRRPLPINWTRYDYDFNIRSLIRIASRATILFDSNATAVFDTADSRVVAYLPTLAGEVATPTLADQASYDAAPLQFIISRRTDHVKSGVAHATRVIEDSLNKLRSELWMGRNVERFAEAVAKLSGHIAHAAPEAALTAVTYFVVARQLNLSDAETVATLEGIVHAVIRTISRFVRDRPHA